MVVHPPDKFVVPIPDTSLSGSKVVLFLRQPLSGTSCSASAGSQGWQRGRQSHALAGKDTGPQHLNKESCAGLRQWGGAARGPVATVAAPPMRLVGGQAREPSQWTRVSKVQGQEVLTCKMAQARAKEQEPELKCNSWAKEEEVLHEASHGSSSQHSCFHRSFIQGCMAAPRQSQPWTQAATPWGAGWKVCRVSPPHTGPWHPAAFLRCYSHLIFKFKQLKPHGNMMFHGFSVILIFQPIALQIMDLENILQIAMYQAC